MQSELGCFTVSTRTNMAILLTVAILGLGATLDWHKRIPGS